MERKVMGESRVIEYIVFHTSASGDQDIGAKEIREWHKEKGWSDIGYHYVIRRDGTIEQGRPLEKIGAHVRGYNSRSIGICMIGGKKTIQGWVGGYTPEQWVAAGYLAGKLHAAFPDAQFKGHRDFSPDLNKDGKITRDEWIKECPCFDVESVIKLPSIPGVDDE